MTNHIEHLKSIAPPLLKWFDANKRELPWRSDPTPYHVWISEIMLQQTRVEAVRSYYQRFMKALPDVDALSACPDDRLMKLWEGLGYYSRARNLKKAAIEIIQTYQGELPGDVKLLRQLPGIGPYTSGAIASIAFGRKVPAVDGNVLRVISRILGSYEDISLNATKKWIEAMLEEAMPEMHPGEYNQALMELGALVCVPGGPPHCEVCPIREICTAHTAHMTDEIPVKTPKKKRRAENKTVLILYDGIYTLIRKRPEEGLLAGLYEPLTLDGHLSENEIKLALKELGVDAVRFWDLPVSKHIFTHIEWHMKGYRILVSDLEPFVNHESSCFACRPEDVLQLYSIPSAFRAYRPYMLWGDLRNGL